MKNISVAQQMRRASLAGALLAVLAMPAGAVDLQTSDGSWTFSLSGNVNVDYIYSNCESPSSAVQVDGGLTCVGNTHSNGISNIGNGLLPAAFSFGVATTQNGIDLAAHLGLYPGIATNNSGSPNLQPACSNGCTNVALGSTGLDLRQVYMTFGNKQMGTFTLGRNIGLFGADVILNDMTLLGVGAPGSAASAAPSNTTLGGIGFGYIYTDWLAQIDYTTPDLSGFKLTFGVFDPINSLTEPAGSTAEGKKAPGFHAKVSYEMPLGEGNKFYASATVLTQEQDWVSPLGTSYDYRGTGEDIFAKFDWQGFEVFGYYYHADGLGTTALFLDGAVTSDALGIFGATRTSKGYLAQITYKVADVKFGVNYGDSKLDKNSVDDPFLVSDNKKGTVGVYYSLTKNLTLLGEVSRTKSESDAGSNDSTTVNVGAFLAF